MTGRVGTPSPLPPAPLRRSHSAPVTQVSGVHVPPRLTRARSLADMAREAPSPVAPPPSQPKAEPTAPPADARRSVPVEERLTAPAIDSVGNPYSIVLDTPGQSAPLNFMGDRLVLLDHDVLVAPVGEYRMARNAAGTRRTEHSVGTTQHGHLDTLLRQGLAAGLVHTEGDHTPGIFHQQLDAEGLVARAAHEKTHELGPLTAKTMLNVAGFHSQSEAGLRLNTNKGQQQLIAYGRGRTTMGAHATVIGHVGNQNASLVGRADLRGGLIAEGEGGLVVDRQNGDFFVQARIMGLAGIEAKTQAQAQLGPFIAYGGVSAKAGLGYEFGVGAGIKDGVIKAQANLGAAFAVGGTSWAGMGFDTRWVQHRHEEHHLHKAQRAEARAHEPHPPHHLHRPEWARFHQVGTQTAFQAPALPPSAPRKPATSAWEE
ncbi:MAG: hypothetical protein ABW123_28030 [Cystobacter sp.]